MHLIRRSFQRLREVTLGKTRKRNFVEQPSPTIVEAKVICRLLIHK
jgi:hypothetical protein